MSRQRTFRNIALIGFMGTGKSSVGRLLAMQLNFEYVDTDAMIETRSGMSIADIFEQAGEPAFRALEQQVVNELSRLDRSVISTGGGLAANADNLNSLKEHALLVSLWASPEIIWERVRHQSNRPLLRSPDPMATIRKLLAEREAYYKQADVLINSEMRPVKEVAQHVLHQFYSMRPELKA